MIVKLRQHKTSTNKLVLLGRSADTNEELIKQAQKNEILLHTVTPGSPFANIKALESEVVKSEIYEAAVMCAKYSQDWRDNKKDVKIHVFTGADVFKTPGMSNGTFGVKKYKEVVAKKEDIIKFERTVQT